MPKTKPGSVEDYPHNYGYCVICEQPAIFVEIQSWLRDFYLCTRCTSIPRQRAIVNTLNTFYPKWRNLDMHESSPGGVLSDFLQSQSKSYSASHYYDDIPRGKFKGQYRSEDLCKMTISKNSFDIFVTSDVFEHVYKAERAFKEIARVLRPGGAHIFTTPWKKDLPITVKRAEMKRGKLVLHKRKEFHGNPISEDGSLVTYDWGADFIDFIYKASGLVTTVYLVKNRDLGLEAEYLEVFISRKV